MVKKQLKIRSQHHSSSSSSIPSSIEIKDNNDDQNSQESSIGAKSEFAAATLKVNNEPTVVNNID